jgi:hypothetical protein
VPFILVPIFGPLNAISREALGLIHGESHVAQLRDTLRLAHS